MSKITITEDELLELTAAMQDFITAGRALYGEAYTRRYWVREGFLVIRDQIASERSLHEALGYLYEDTAKFHKLAEPRPSTTISAYSWS